MSNTIFIQIAAYRDPQLVPTIKDCLAQAAHPENLVFGIAWQHSNDDVWDTLDEFRSDPRFKILDIPYEESKGACWARNSIQRLYNNEKYTLQLDSHHRFVPEWDTKCIAMIEELQAKGHTKPLLTTYLPSFDPEKDPESRIHIPWKMNFDRFIPEGAVFFLPASIDNYKELTSPIPARFYSGHFCFTLGQFVKEVAHDPEYYFHGEEISIAVRAFTHGYDLFHPHQIIAWHEYTRKGRTKQWEDDKEWGKRNSSCHLRNRKLFGMDGEPQDIDFGRYGFGKKRTLDQYERYAGVSFKRRAIQKHTVENKLAPNPILSEEEYQNSFLTIFKHCIDIHRESVPETDYDFWVIAFEDKDGNTIHRQDADVREIQNMLRDKEKTFLNIWRTFNTDVKPYKWVVWPHSISKDWCTKIEHTL